jgi:hypothetical protein
LPWSVAWNIWTTRSEYNVHWGNGKHKRANIKKLLERMFEKIDKGYTEKYVLL